MQGMSGIVGRGGSEGDKSLAAQLKQAKADMRRMSRGSIDMRRGSRTGSLVLPQGLLMEPQRDRLEWHEIMKTIPVFANFDDDQVP